MVEIGFRSLVSGYIPMPGLLRVVVRAIFFGRGVGESFCPLGWVEAERERERDYARPLDD